MARDEVIREIFHILMRVQYSRENLPENISEGKEIEFDDLVTELESPVDEISIPAVKQSKLDDYVGCSQGTITNAVKELENRDLIIKKTGRPNKIWLKPEAEIILGEELDIDVESDSEFNRITKKLVEKGYPEEDLSTDEKREILSEAEQIVSRLKPSMDVPTEKENKIWVEVLWGELLQELKIGRSNEPEDWIRLELDTAIREEEIETDRPFTEHRYILNMEKLLREYFEKDYASGI